MSAAGTLLARELRLVFARGGGPLLALGFFACVAAVLPLAVGPAPGKLALVAQGAAWTALALSMLLGLDRLFEPDLDDGALDLLALGPLPLAFVGAIKCLAQWLVNGAPLALAAPIVEVALGGPPRAAPMMLAAGALGSLAFAFVGGTGAALVVAARRGGLLIAVIVIPLIVPPVIFGGVAIDAYASGQPWAPALALLGAYALAAVALSPLAMGAACRNALG
ncbi:MAG TPA: heme exporter protein CcmB [Caulobacteraceae bacterium]|nr:heme exporter protein CcmB [Caulobacteraceae bacterium]